MTTGNMPSWLETLIAPPDDKQRVRDEIEIKFLLRKEQAQAFIHAPGVRVEPIEQVYLDYAQIQYYLTEDLTPEQPDTYPEWRIRSLGDRYKLTAKKPTTIDAAQRTEFEKDISADLYQTLLAVAEAQGALRKVSKTRYSRVLTFSQQQVLAQLDDYHFAGTQAIQADFVTCEVEVPELRLAKISKVSSLVFHPP